MGLGFNMKAQCLWLTGLSGSGKTTIANALEKYFTKCQILDGDIVRDSPMGVDVGFSKEDRYKHIQRMGFIAKMLVDNGITAICAFVSPDYVARNMVRAMFKEGEFFEIFVDASLEECKKRDVKGLYAKAASGEIEDFTGVGSPYQKPEQPDLIINTKKHSVDSCIADILLHVGYYNKEIYSMFVGRWQGVFHKGHEEIINVELEKGKKVLLCVRDVPYCEDKNPWSAKEVKRMLDFVYKENDNVEVVVIPDISSINHGRDTGYSINKIESNIKNISGTQIRKMIDDKNYKWVPLVPKMFARFILDKEDA